MEDKPDMTVNVIVQTWTPPEGSGFKYPTDKIADMLHDDYSLEEAIEQTALHFGSTYDDVRESLGPIVLHLDDIIGEYEGICRCTVSARRKYSPGDKIKSIVSMEVIVKSDPGEINPFKGFQIPKGTEATVKGYDDDPEFAGEIWIKAMITSAFGWDKEVFIEHKHFYQWVKEDK